MNKSEQEKALVTDVAAAMNSVEEALQSLRSAAMNADELELWGENANIEATMLRLSEVGARVARQHRVVVAMFSVEPLAAWELELRENFLQR